MGIQICSHISKSKISAPAICVYSFFTDHPKWVAKSICHFVHEGPHLHLQNGYPNMLSDFKTKKFNPWYPRPFVFHGSSEISPEINLSLCACGATLSSPKWVSRYALEFKNRKFQPPISAFVHFSRIIQNESRNQFVILFLRGHTCISKMGIQIYSQISKTKILAPEIRVRSFFMDHPKWVPKSIRHFVHVRPRLHLQNGYPNMLSDIKTEKFSLRLFLFNELSTFKMFFRHYKALLKYFKNFVKYFKGFLEHFKIFQNIVKRLSS